MMYIVIILANLCPHLTRSEEKHRFSSKRLLIQTIHSLDLTAGERGLCSLLSLSIKEVVSSQLEEDAIQTSQPTDVRRNLVMDILGTDEEEEEVEGPRVEADESVKEATYLDDGDMFDSDEEGLELALDEVQEEREMEQTLKLSQAVTNRLTFSSSLPLPLYNLNFPREEMEFFEGILKSQKEH